MEFACFRDHRLVLRQFETHLLSLLWPLNKTLSFHVSYLLPMTSRIGPAPKSLSLCSLARWVLAGPALLNAWAGQCGLLSSGSFVMMKQEVQFLRGDSKPER